eukprot:scaffold226_cov302-Prasinococcus_capsulatus_cf.AAC.1
MNNGGEAAPATESLEHKEDHNMAPAVEETENAGAVEEDADTTVSIKVLISNANAGSVIGKGGSTINEFQVQSGARIQLSRTKEFFPGTTERILVLTGTAKTVLTALHLILQKFFQEETGNVQVINSTQTTVKMIVPNACCGAVIGRAGSTIRTIVEDCGAHIKISSPEDCYPGVSDRVVTVTGQMEQVIRGVYLVITKVSEDPNYMGFGNVVFPYQNIVPPQPHAHHSLHLPPQAGPPPLVFPTSGPAVTLSVAVPDQHIGAVVGRGGKSITEIQQMAAVKIKISERGDFVEGTNNRKVTITGSSEATQIAQYLITQKVQQSAAEQAQRSAQTAGV